LSEWKNAGLLQMTNQQPGQRLPEEGRNSFWNGKAVADSGIRKRL